MVARTHGVREVVGSSPASPTIDIRPTNVPLTSEASERQKPHKRSDVPPSKYKISPFVKSPIYAIIYRYQKSKPLTKTNMSKKVLISAGIIAAILIVVIAV